jgi:hypothetical protein
MPVPKATMHEYDGLPAAEDQVRLTGQVSVVQPVPECQPKSSDDASANAGGGKRIDVTSTPSRE